MVLTYSKVDGRIHGVWSGTPALLEAQAQAANATVGTLTIETTETPAILQEQWRVVDEALVAKTASQIVAMPNPFVADGLSPCEITVEPFLPCILMLAGELFVLTEADPVLFLTSAVAQTWQVSLQPSGLLWAPPITVEAI